MRGFTKAAALLSSTFTFAIVIPGTTSSISHLVSGEQAESIVDYRSSDAFVEFRVPCPECHQAGEDQEREDQTFTFQVDATNRPCGESAVSVNGQNLLSHWNGISADGHGIIHSRNTNVEDYKENFSFFASWKITCSFDTLPTTAVNSQGDDVAQVLTFSVDTPERNTRTGFVVSYKQLGHPQIFRLIPSVGIFVDSDSEYWRTPSPIFRPKSTAIEKTTSKDGKLVITEQKETSEPCRGLRCSFKSMLRKAHGLVHISCHRLRNAHTTTPEADTQSGIAPLSRQKALSSVPQISSDRLIEAQTSPPESSTSSSKPSRVLKTEPSRCALAARSSCKAIHTLKFLAWVVGLTAVIGCVFKNLRNPRLRADRAARREECRNRRLYRHAAMLHQWRSWLCGVRNRLGSSTGKAKTWDEKRTLALRQENWREVVMHGDFRALRNAHGVVSDLVRAEEGRIMNVHELNGSERRGSSETLPRYESEILQPPTYEETSIDDGVVDGFQYTPAESEDTPDSSVIDTSPRTSRDGRDSDFGKE